MKKILSKKMIKSKTTKTKSKNLEPLSNKSLINNKNYNKNMNL